QFPDLVELGAVVVGQHRGRALVGGLEVVPAVGEHVAEVRLGHGTSLGDRVLVVLVGAQGGPPGTRRDQGGGQRHRRQQPDRRSQRGQAPSGASGSLGRASPSHCEVGGGG